MPDIDYHPFSRDDEAEIYLWELDNYDGMWQSASGETIVIDAEQWEYSASSKRYSSSGTINDAGQGMGLYIYDHEGYAYICPSADGNSFTISNGSSERFNDSGKFEGVFYRNGDIGAYTDLSQAEFYEDPYYGWMWYFDGVNTYFLGDGYEIGDDGFAYHEDDGKIYPAGWIPKPSYDSADDWYEEWAVNWDT